MAKSRCRCPRCDTLVRADEPVRSGDRLRCPSCDRSFVVEDDWDRDPDERRGRTGLARGEDVDLGKWRDRRSRRDEYEEDDRPRRRSGSRRRPDDFSLGLVIGLTIGGLVLFTGIGIGCYFIFRSTSKDTGPAAGKELGGDAVAPLPANAGFLGNPPMGGIPNNPPKIGFPGNNPPMGGFPDNPNGGGRGLGKINKENFARVQLGMTEDQVRAILGPPTATFKDLAGRPNCKSMHFTQQGGGIIDFENGRVVSKFGGG
jgi:hypothetical protein